MIDFKMTFLQAQEQLLGGVEAEKLVQALLQTAVGTLFQHPGYRLLLGEGESGTQAGEERSADLKSLSIG